MRRTLPALLLACCLPLAACGSSATGSTAASAIQSKGYTTMVRYAECMRAHGVPRFPDPQPGGGLLLRAGPGTGIDPSSPAFQSAQQTCRSLLPNGGVAKPLSASRRRAMLQFSACMRSHGLPNFPDPVFSGNGGAQLRIEKSTGIAPSSPAFKSAQQACGSLLQSLSQGTGIGG
jgi:hypothetical protein